MQGFEDESSLDMKLSTGFHNLSGEGAAIHCGRQFAAGIHWACGKQFVKQGLCCERGADFRPFCTCKEV